MSHHRTRFYISHTTCNSNDNCFNYACLCECSSFDLIPLTQSVDVFYWKSGIHGRLSKKDSKSRVAPARLGCFYFSQAGEKTNLTLNCSPFFERRSTPQTISSSWTKSTNSLSSPSLDSLDLSMGVFITRDVDDSLSFHWDLSWCCDLLFQRSNSSSMQQSIKRSRA